MFPAMRWCLSIAILSGACNDLATRDPGGVRGILGSQEDSGDAEENQTAGGDLSTSTIDKQTESTISVQEPASEPVSVAGSYLTCALPKPTTAPEGYYNIYCDLASDQPTSSAWKFYLARDGAQEAEVPATMLDDMGKKWQIKTAILPSDQTLRVTARRDDGTGNPIAAPADITPADIEAVKILNSPNPQQVVNSLKLFLMTVAPPPAALSPLALTSSLAAPIIDNTLYFTAGPMVSVLGVAIQTLKTAKLSDIKAASTVPYRVMVKSLNGGVVFDIVDATTNKSTNSCLDVQQESMKVGTRLIRFECNFTQGSVQNFVIQMNPDKVSFMIKVNSGGTNLCVGTVPPSSQLELTDCAKGILFRLSTAPAEIKL